MSSKAVFGTKIGMTHFFNETGEFIPVTVIKAFDCTVTRKKTIDIDGYDSVQVCFGDVKEHKVNKPLKGHFSKCGVPLKRYIREIKFKDVDKYNIGDVINTLIFSNDDIVDVIAITKGKGFAGSIKRHGSHRGPMAHGSGYHRGSGSMGQRSLPGRVYKGKKLPGHMGHVKVTVQNLKIAKIDSEKNLIFIVGSIPGPNKATVFIRDAIKQRVEQ